MLAFLAMVQVVSAEEPATSGTDPLEGALEALVNQDLARACILLRRVVEDEPGKPSARRAKALADTAHRADARYCQWAVESPVEEVGASSGAEEPGGDPPIREPESPRVAPEARDGRTELLISQALIWPVWAGAAVPLYSPDGASAEATGLAVLVGLGVGLGGTYIATQDRPVSSGQAMTVYTGELLGTWYGLWLDAALAEDAPTGRAAHLGTLGGGLLGVGAAALVPEVSSGDVALARSGALWGTAFAGLALGYVEEPNPRRAFGTIGLGTTLGLVTTSLLAKRFELRRGQVNAINLGGYAGALTSGAILLVTQPSDVESAVTVVGVGTILGLTTASILVARGDGTTASRLEANAVVTMRRGADGRLSPVVGLHSSF